MAPTKFSSGLILCCIATVAIVLMSAASASATPTFNILWAFNPANGNAGPGYCNGGVFDSAGNFYSATQYGGASQHDSNPGTGAVFELSPNGKGGWTETVIYSFGLQYSGDGNGPCGGLIIDKNGNLYGTTYSGGLYDTGTVYKLSPSAGGTWTETLLYSFGPAGSPDGANPHAGVALDSKGNLYGTTDCGGTGPVNQDQCSFTSGSGSGIVFQLTPASKGEWKETVLHNFSGTDGAVPYSAVLLASGKLFGTTCFGGPSDMGVIYEIEPGNDGAVETVLHSFTGPDGANPEYETPSIDAAGNLYGTTIGGGANSGGTVWEEVYSASQKTYTEQVLYSFGAIGSNDGSLPLWGILKDKNGDWYGATNIGGGGTGCGGDGCGSVFQLAPAGSGFKESIFGFSGALGGGNPGYNNLVLDKSGNVWGVTGGGWQDDPGTYYQYGVVFELTK